MTKAEVANCMSALSWAKSILSNGVHDQKDDVLIHHYIFELGCMELFLHNKYGEEFHEVANNESDT